jgi:hypothetical protein
MAEQSLSPEAARLLAARKAAVEELRQIDGRDRAIDDHDVRRLSAARLLIDSLNARMLDPGDHPVSPADLKQADAMVEEVLDQAGKRRTTIELKILDGEGAVSFENRPGESMRDAFLRHGKAAAESPTQPDKAVAVQAADPSAKPPIRNEAPVKPVKASSHALAATESLPLHERIAATKDSRPNAAPANGGGLCIMTSRPSSNPQIGGDPHPFRRLDR